MELWLEYVKVAITIKYICLHCSSYQTRVSFLLHFFSLLVHYFLNKPLNLQEGLPVSKDLCGFRNGNGGLCLFYYLALTCNSESGELWVEAEAESQVSLSAAVVPSGDLNSQGLASAS